MKTVTEIQAMAERFDYKALDGNRDQYRTTHKDLSDTGPFLVIAADTTTATMKNGTTFGIMRAAVYFPEDDNVSYLSISGSVMKYLQGYINNRTGSDENPFPVIVEVFDTGKKYNGYTIYNARVKSFTGKAAKQFMADYEEKCKAKEQEPASNVAIDDVDDLPF